jgi:hypothetical protein
MMSIFFTIWTVTGNQGQQWKRAEVEFTSQHHPFQLRFSPLRGDGDLGDIALDSVKLLRRTCK